MFFGSIETPQLWRASNADQENTMLLQANSECSHTVTLRGEHLTIAEVARVARDGAPVALAEDAETLRRIQAACEVVAEAVSSGKRIYGVNTGLGGMAAVSIPIEQIRELQMNLMWFLKAGAGPRLPKEDVRAAMVLRANSHLRGASGVRYELIRRFAIFLNAGVTPHVRAFGSIGASGDLVPLASIAGALIGLDRAFTVDFNGESMSAPAALARLGLPPLDLQPKEGLP